MSIEALVAVVYGPAVKGGKAIGAQDVLRVLLVYAEHADTDGRGACPSQRQIMELLGWTYRRSVEQAIAALVIQGRVRKTAEAIPRVRGAVYDLEISARHSPSEISARHGPSESGATRPGNSARQLGQATRPDIARSEPEPEPENPPTPLPKDDGASRAPAGQEEAHRVEPAATESRLQTGLKPAILDAVLDAVLDDAAARIVQTRENNGWPVNNRPRAIAAARKQINPADIDAARRWLTEGRDSHRAATSLASRVTDPDSHSTPPEPAGSYSTLVRDTRPNCSRGCDHGWFTRYDDDGHRWSDRCECLEGGTP